MKVRGKRFFVTGGAGFVGSNMLELLTRSGAEAIVYDNLSSGRQEFVDRFTRKGVAFLKGDLLDRAKLSRAIKSDDVDAVIHLAANPDVAAGIKITDMDLKQGTIATYNVLEAARRNDIKDIIFSSSSVVYGIPTVRPTPEDYGPLLPISLYGASKLASEGLITAFSHLYGMNYYIYRFANVIGNNSTHGVFFDFVKKLRKNPRSLEVLGNGRQRKSYIDVRDCVSAMIYIYEKSRLGENVYNLSTEGQTSVEEIAKMVIGRMAPKARIRYTGGEQGWPGDISNTYLSNKRMLKFGFRPKFERSIDVVRNHVNTMALA